jgi:beta-glucosidase
VADAPLYRDASQPVGVRTRDLLARMTLEEKLAQLGAVWASALLESDRFAPEKAKALLAHGTGHVTRIGGSTLLGPAETAAIVNDLQRHLLEETRLGIPAIVHEESCAGYTAKGATQFPQAIGLAATFDPELARAMADVIRVQMRAVGALQTLAPVLDVARDPRWGRCEETFGEDPYLAARMGVAYVQGVQGSSLAEGIAATGKHFLGYGTSEGGLNWAPTPLARRELLERILPPFAAAIGEARLASVMNGYHEIDGVPCGASPWLLDEILRGELGFEGAVVADYFTVICLLSYHRVAADESEAAARALEAGLDVELPVRQCFGAPLAQALASGRVALETVDRAVARVLATKFALGLFERPTVDAAAAPAFFDTPAQRALARRIAAASMVLLQDDATRLPLDPNLATLAVIGPSAASRRNLQGDYHYPTHLEIVFGPMHEGGFDAAPAGGATSTWQPGQAQAARADLLAHFPPTVTVLDGIREAVSPATRVLHAPGCGFQGDATEGFAEACAAAAAAEVAILVLGGRSGLLPHCTSGEAVDRATLGLPGVQQQLLEAVAATGTPVVVVIVDGRPLALTEVVAVAPTVLLAWLPGEEGGRAVADVLFGRVAPAGRLPMTLPRAVGQVPLYYNHKPSGARSQFYGDYRDLPCSPLFPFGHGLSTTRFHYEALELSAREPGVTDLLEVAVRLTNVGSRAGEEVVQLYLRDQVASVTRPVKELKGFARIALAPGEARCVRFVLDLRQLAFHDLGMDFVVEPGQVDVMVGASSEDIRLQEVIHTAGARTRVRRQTVRPTRVSVE